jgi:hypothetical protein
MTMTIEIGDCAQRQCKQYCGINANGDEYCLAFPNGIPMEINFGGLEHTVPFREDGGDQDEVGGLLYERDETMPNFVGQVVIPGFDGAPPIAK